MSDLCPYTPAVLTRLAADAKACIERGEPDALVTLCRELLPWSGTESVDRALGKALRLLLRHGPPGMIAQIEAEAFAIDRLLTGWNPENASAAYLNWKYRQVFGTERDPDLAQAKDFAAAAEALWPHVDEPTRLSHGLYLKLATAHGTLGNIQALRDLGTDLLSGPLTHEREQAGLLRIIKQLQRLRAAPELEFLLEQMLTHPGHNPPRVEAALTAVEALRQSAQRLADYERLGRLLDRLVQWLEPQGLALCDARLVNALLRCAAFDQLHQLVPHLLANIEKVDVRSTLLSLLEQLQRYDILGDAGLHIKRVYQKDPGDPLAALLFGRYLEAQGVPVKEIEPVFESVRREAPRYDEAVLWRAHQHYRLAQHTKLLSWLESHPLNDPEKAHFLLKRVQTAIDRHPFPDRVSATDGDRLSTHAMGSLAPFLEPLAQVLNGNLSDTAEPPLSELRSHLRRIALDVTRATAPSSGLAFSDCLNTVGQLRRVAGTLEYLAAGWFLYASIEHRRKTFTLPQYGGPDHERIRVIFETLHRVTMQLSKHAIEAALEGASIQDVRQLCRFADMHVRSEFALGECLASEELLHKLRTRQLAPSLILQLLERCALQRGDLQSAARWGVGQLPIAGELYGLEPFDAWVRKEGVQSKVLIEQEPWQGTFEYINRQGTLHTAPHEVPGTCVELVHVPGLRIRDTELLIGSKATIARPHPTHFRNVYGYPRESSTRLNYGHGGCRLGPAKDRLHVCEPVVVLGNMDAPYWNNYYHWMLMSLTRVAVLLDGGELEHRRLLLPMELSEWMMTSLELIGLPSERMLRYTAEQEVLLDEAWVVGPVEYAAAALMKPLQRRLWVAAGVDPEGISTRAVWLSRRQEPQRYLANTDAIEALARHLGFDVVNPGTLNLLDQVRLCASAKIIAGPEGSNFTNLMFARPRSRVLTLMVAGGDYETWLDMCAMGDLQQRWIFGREDPRRSWWAFHHEPYEVDLTLVERELRRLTAEAS